MKYKILEAKIKKENLEELVMDYLDRGWEPIGGILVVQSDTGMWWYYQAVKKGLPRVREEQE